MPYPAYRYLEACGKDFQAYCIVNSMWKSKLSSNMNENSMKTPNVLWKYLGTFLCLKDHDMIWM